MSPPLHGPLHSPFPLYAPDALRALEARGTQLLGGDAFALMARAGQAGWRCALRHWPLAMRIVVACGPGNNGGDGYVLAMHALQAGRAVTVRQVDAPATPLARRAHDDFVSAGGEVVAFDAGIGEADLLVDAIFGIGLTRAPEVAASGLIDAINAHPAPTLALDVPSGIDAASGGAPGRAVHADRTLQFIARHQGLRTGLAIDHVGALELATLDLPDAVFAGIQASAQGWRADALAGFFPLRPRNHHKGRSGHVLCVGGDHGGGGAIVLAAEAALRCGAGLASLATRTPHISAALARRPELMGHAVESVGELVPLLPRADVLAIGPGLGQAAWGHGLLAMALGQPQPRVLDADALNLVAANNWTPSTGDIVTPHPGEAARLLGSTTDAVQRDRFAAAAALGDRLGTTVVLKGAGSIVASPGALPAVICAGNPGMAVGGMGDVLTGVIASLLAQGFHARDAAIAGVLLHAAAGDAAAREEGERGLLPSDLMPWLRRLVNPVRR